MTPPPPPARADLAAIPRATLLCLVDAQAARIDKTLALHARVDSVFGHGRAFCAHDHEDYPCPTVRALTEES